MNYRKLNYEVMTDTKKQYTKNEELQAAVQQSISHQHMVSHEEEISLPAIDKRETNYITSGKRSFEAAKGYKGKKVAVLNFANNHSIGGAPFSAGAQEESLCRCSTLLPCLEAMRKPFYQKHRDDYEQGLMNFMGNDDLIYTPDVVVFKTDERTDPVYPQMLPHDEWYKVDVITCAAPDFRGGQHLPQNYEVQITSRIKKILDVACKERVEVLILGAWGCGAFKNPSEIVAKVFHTLLPNYDFETVEFALASHQDVSNSVFVMKQNLLESYLSSEGPDDKEKHNSNILYDSSTILSTTKEFNQLKRVNSRYSAALVKYKRYTIAKFVYDYQHYLKGKEVYDKLMAAVAPNYLKELNPELQTKDSIAPPKYSMEDLLLQPKRLLPYVSNMHQSIGRLMDAAISQAISITIDHSSKPTSINYGKGLQMFFKEHLDKNEISKRLAVTKEHVRKSFIGKFIEGEDYVEGITIYEPFKQDVTNFMNSLSYHACDSVFEENDIDTPEKCEFACALTGKDFFNNMKEWGNSFVVTEKDCVRVTKQHLISLKLAICAAIVPVKLSDLIERTKRDFIVKNEPTLFNPHIIEAFVDSHPWIDKDEEGRYFILTPHLTATYQRQGRIIFEEGGLIHYNKVKTIYESIYGESYKMDGLQTNMLTNRPEHDFFPYGKTGQWYYSEDGTQLAVPDKVLYDFVDKHIIFYWKDLADVVNQLLTVNKHLDKRRIRQAVTNLCYTDKANPDHFVKKGEEDKYPDFSWNNGKKTRTNWVVNHAYELLKDAPGKKMLWTDFEKQFKEDVIETGRPLKVIEDIKYKHSGTADKELLFIRENGYISINEDVLQKTYNNDLSMVGIYRKYPEYYNTIFSLAMTELRKHPDNTMMLTDFISLALDNVESEGAIDSRYIRHIFDCNDKLPVGLSRYNEEGSVFIKLDLAVADAETKDDIQYEVTAAPADDSQVAPVLVVSNTTRPPVTYTTRFTWDDVKKALKADLSFYDSPFWYPGITSDDVLDKFVNVLSSSDNYNLNDLVPQIIYEFHYARIDRYDLYQYIRNLPVAFEALLREIYESSHRPIQTHGIKALCENGFTDFDDALTHHEKKGFGRILNDLVYKRNLLLHGANLELSIVTLNQNIVEYIALFVYTINKYALTI